MGILGVIPARYASSRFPGKPLADIQGKSMIARVYSQCEKAKGLDAVMVATDDTRIYEHVAAFGGQVSMTSEHHMSGTERVAEIAALYPGFTHYINIQGDEPFLSPHQIDQVATLLLENPDLNIATLVKPIHEVSALFSPHVVKTVRDEAGYALYFSRSPIPYCRAATTREAWFEHHTYFKHIGIYGFTQEMLLRIPHLPPVAAEQAESLEQLRWLGHGYPILTAVTHEEAVAIDTPQDLENLLSHLSAD